ncbi:MAG: 3-phosphoshikimate 1-carboxyvinyltransferase [Chthoniobacterales bacterium]|nr:3-phosphoshikimate 1-carboxyvinyltransferase [Chthoniobacterales bacterium]
MSFKIVPTSAPFRGTITLPGDKSISHRALMLAAISKGTSTITGLPEGDDVQATHHALEQLGIAIESPEPGKIKVYGQGGKFSQSSDPIDCKNSGTTMRLLSGLLAAQPFSSQLIGDASLSQRPMERIITPLRIMGSTIDAEGKNDRAPILVGGNKNFSPLHDYTLPIASAQLKSALLLAALFAKGTTTIIEPTPTRDHTERLFQAFQLSFNETKIGTSKKFSLTGPQTPQACDISIPGDISSAAFWIVAAAARPESHLQLEDVGLNPTRTGFLQVLKRMGANIKIRGQIRGQSLNLQNLGSDPKIHRLALNSTISGTDPFGEIIVHGSSLTGTTIEGNEIPGLIDELPILAVAGALAQGTSIIRDARELRVKETDRIAALVHNLCAMGVSAFEHPDGLEIKGGSRLQGAPLKSFGDHRIAMAFSIAALFAEGTSTIDDTNCIATSYPGFAAELQRVASNE